MIRQYSITGLLAALCLLLAGCSDPRRDIVRSYLQAHPPDGFDVAQIPEKITITKAADGGSESVVTVKYRLKHSTVEVFDALAQPRGLAIANRIAAMRGWALASLPAGDPTRDQIVAASARSTLPVKRVVTPAGTGFEALVVLTLRKESNTWQVVSESLDVHAPGTPDNDASIPLADSAEVATKLDDLETLAKHLEDSRKEYLAERERTAARSLADLRSQVKTGSVFTGRLSDRTLLRLVISRGMENDEPVVAVLTVLRDPQSSARYTGALVQEPSGDYAWRASLVTTLSGNEPINDSNLHPILSLAPNSQGLSVQIQNDLQPPVSIQFRPAGKVDLIPEASEKVIDN